MAWNYQLHQSLFAIERAVHWKRFVLSSDKDRRFLTSLLGVLIRFLRVEMLFLVLSDWISVFYSNDK